ncbi:wax ester/triacylglycerol synthase family O-acyltransferase [Rhodococcus sp. IEGM 1366]|uniref:wax ester/triacylglycerol synthase domain-containing protein n=1 Tax=Rhodococcus sp. IEGM 1366 TaxID=3082223 RepID=UPI0029559B35|nr:wax ester/triacylglycerol synthase domain-containing protein [Rhodococcus sp. IEGM 1366]MDV8069820.1 wax ester/triacylglycerol synthase family O-acyltransferase [Rhodococcus sp. IEGM 1366]
MIFRNSLPTGVAQLGPRDAEFIYNESEGHLSHMVCAYFFDTAGHPLADMTHADAVGWISERFGYWPLFTSRVQRVPLDLDYPYWVPAPDFDVDDHVRVHKASGPGWAPVRALLGKSLSAPMDLTRPPWELEVMTGISGIDDLPGDLTLIMLKTHHSAGDGLEIRNLTNRLFSGPAKPKSSARESGLPLVEMMGRSVLGFPGQLIRFGKGLSATKVAAEEITQAEESGELAKYVADRPPTRFNHVLEGDLALEFVTLDGADIKAIRAAVPGVTVNDIFLTVVAGALEKYLEEKDERPERPLAAMVPRSMRQIAEWESANQLALLTVDLHSDVADPVEKLTRIRDSAQVAKERSSHLAVRKFSTRIETSPAPLLRLTGLARRLNKLNTDREVMQHTTISNVPVTIDGNVFDGAPAVAVLGGQAPVDGDVLRHFLIAAAGGALTLNVIVARGAMPDPEHYVVLLRESFDELRQAVECDVPAVE